jgi:uncharacterized protein YbaP (TraB family)
MKERIDELLFFTAKSLHKNWLLSKNQFLMKTISFFCLLVLSFTSSQAQLLWEISGKNLSQPSYLFGTIHIGNPKVYNFPDSLELCWQSCSVMAGEINMQNVNLNELMPKLYMPGDTSLSQILDSVRYSVVKKAIASKLGFFAIFADRIKPIYLASLFADAENLSSTKNPALDLYLQNESKKNGQSVIGLENISEQLEALDKISLKTQADMLYELVADMDSNKPSELEILLEKYLQGDIEGLFEVTTEKLDSASVFALLTRRNIRMTNRLTRHINEGKTVFAAVGAGHLAGKNGMIALLREKGFFLRPVAWKHK